MIRVFLAGEGSSELGSRSGHPSYQSDDHPGALQALLRAVRADGWEVVGAIDWRRIRKLKVNAPSSGDERNVHAVSLHATEAGAHVVAFARDRDRIEEREADIERAIDTAGPERGLRIIGGVAVETLEAWLIALTGEVGSEAIRHPEEEMGRLGLVAKSAAHYADHVEKHGLARIAGDAGSLRRWVARARAALAP
jgi:hypothetical protein